MYSYFSYSINKYCFEIINVCSVTCPVSTKECDESFSIPVRKRFVVSYRHWNVISTGTASLTFQTQKTRKSKVSSSTRIFNFVISRRQISLLNVLLLKHADELKRYCASTIMMFRSRLSACSIITCTLSKGSIRFLWHIKKLLLSLIQNANVRKELP